MSCWIAHARTSGRIRRTRSWWRWGTGGRTGRRGGRSRRPSALAAEARAADAAVDPAAGVVAAAGLRGRTGRGREAGGVVLRVAGVVAVSGGRAVGDKTMASVVIGLDCTLRQVGAVPTYALTDNEKMVTVEHVCGIAVRNATIVEVSRYHGLTIATCEPADPQSKGGSEATVKVAKADLVPTDHNLRVEYAGWPRWSRRALSSWPM
jgi:hypothetical protein